MLKNPRFTQRVVEDAAGASWVYDSSFNLDHHLVVEQLGVAADKSAQGALQDRLAELTMCPLDRRHPLWQFRFVEHYRGCSALLVRIHHCIADGIALMAVKRVAWCPPIPLAEVKAVGKALGCSINDVLLSCVAGAMGAYLQDHGENTHGK